MATTGSAIYDKSRCPMGKPRIRRKLRVRKRCDLCGREIGRKGLCYSCIESAEFTLE